MDLPFHLSQSVTEIRPNTGVAPFTGPGLPEIAIVLADAALKVIDAPAPADRIAVTEEFLASMAQTPPLTTQ